MGFFDKLAELAGGVAKEQNEHYQRGASRAENMSDDALVRAFRQATASGEKWAYAQECQRRGIDPNNY